MIARTVDDRLGIHPHGVVTGGGLVASWTENSIASDALLLTSTGERLVLPLQMDAVRPYDKLSGGLAKQLLHFQRMTSDARAEARALVEFGREAMRARLEVDMSEWAMSTTSRWQERHPEIVAHVRAFDRDGRSRRRRVSANNRHDLELALDLLAGRHRQGLYQAAFWAEAGAVAAIRRTALAAAGWLDIAPIEILHALEMTGCCTLEDAAFVRRATFRWSGGAISVDLVADGWRLLDDSLEVEAVGVSETLAAGLVGERLDQISDLPFPDLLVRAARISSERQLVLSIAGETLLIDAEGRLMPD